MKVSLIISTYNYPGALNLCLQSVLRQTRMPDEILVADDGSRQETKEVIESFVTSLPVPLVHVWHEDRGFRLAAIRNKAIRQAIGEYIIQIDGDIVLERHFIEDHLRYAQKGYFCSGSRAMVSEKKTLEAIDAKVFLPTLFTAGIKARENSLRFPLLTPYFLNHKRVNGCNLAFWREDLFAVNGYDEAIEGWGCEDHDLTDRLRRAGIKQHHLKFMAIQYHLYHKSASKDSLSLNREILRRNELTGTIRCERGLEENVR